LFPFFLFLQFLRKRSFLNPKTDVVFIANTSIREAQITSQNINEISISFSIENGESVQSGIKYGVSLVKETDKGQFTVDEYVSSEVISLSENSLIKKDIKYIAPKNINGEYTILVTLKNESGLTLGLGIAGKITLESSIKGIQILPETCNVTIAGEKDGKKYTLNQGVDISKEESLHLNCKVKNTSELSIEAIPSFVTHYRNIYGEIFSDDGGDTNPIKFNPLEEREISFVLPKATEPQAYDVVTVLKDKENISNAIVIHYVLQGISATIQNLSLDKDYYNKGEEAKLSFFWTPAADGFPGSRGGNLTISAGLTLSATIENRRGANCSDPINQDLDKAKPLVEIPVSITSDCIDPELLLSIKDVNGQVLDEKTFKVETTTKPQEPLNKMTLIIIISILILIVVVGLYLKKNKNNSNSINGGNSIPMGSLFLIITLVAMGSLMPIKKIDAVNFLMLADDDQNEHLSVSLDLNKTVFNPGEEMVVTANAVYNACTNTTSNIEISGFLVSYYTIFPILKSDITVGQSTVFGSGSATVQTDPGDYILRISSTTTSTPYITAVNSTGGQVFKAYTLMDLITMGENLGYVYESGGATGYGRFIIPNSGEVLNIISREGIELEYKTFDIPYTVVATSVDVKVDTVDGPITKSSGSNVEVRWDSEDATWCNCTCRDPKTNETINCGNTNSSSCSGPNNLSNNKLNIGSSVRSTPFPIPSIVTPTKFDVHCE
jgi:hypothetical protein